MSSYKAPIGAPIGRRPLLPPQSRFIRSGVRVEIAKSVAVVRRLLTNFQVDRRLTLLVTNLVICESAPQFAGTTSEGR